MNDEFLDNFDVNDLQIENVLDRKKPKKKVDGKAKGNRTELQLCKLLTQHFGEEFSKAPGSGSRWSQVNYLPEHAKKTLTGDICVPEGFLWVIECKGGYDNKIDLNGVCNGKEIATLESFIEQSSRDAVYCGRKPMICWKRSRQPWLLMVRKTDFPSFKDGDYPYHISYRDWLILNLQDVLDKTDKTFWLSKTS